MKTFVALALLVASVNGFSDEEVKNCKLTVRTTITDGDDRKVKVKVYDTHAYDQKDCEAQANAVKADNDDPENKTITVSHGFRRTKLK